jgi:ubiquinone biosynthesis protein Coq4
MKSITLTVLKSNTLKLYLRYHDIWNMMTGQSTNFILEIEILEQQNHLV